MGKSPSTVNRNWLGVPQILKNKKEKAAMTVALIHLLIRIKILKTFFLEIEVQTLKFKH